VILVASFSAIEIVTFTAGLIDLKIWSSRVKSVNIYFVLYVKVELSKISGKILFFIVNAIMDTVHLLITCLIEMGWKAIEYLAPLF